MTEAAGLDEDEDGFDESYVPEYSVLLTASGDAAEKAMPVVLAEASASSSFWVSWFVLVLISLIFSLIY